MKRTKKEFGIAVRLRARYPGKAGIGRLVLPIPPALSRAFGWKVGHRFRFKGKYHRLVLTSLRMPSALRGLPAWIAQPLTRRAANTGFASP